MSFADVFCQDSHWAFGAYGIATVKRSTAAEITLSVPSCNASVRLPMRQALQRLRKPIDAQEVGGILELLKAPTPTPSKEPWVRRMRQYRERLSHGLPEELAAIYRDLGRRERLSFAELSVFKQAKELLLGELSLVLPGAERQIQEAAGCLR